MAVRRGPVWIVIAVLGIAAFAIASLVNVGRVAESPLAVAKPRLAYNLGLLPTGLDSLTSLADASRQIEECPDD